MNSTHIDDVRRDVKQAELKRREREFYAAKKRRQDRGEGEFDARTG